MQHRQRVAVGAQSPESLTSSRECLGHFAESSVIGDRPLRWGLSVRRQREPGSYGFHLAPAQSRPRWKAKRTVRKHGCTGSEENNEPWRGMAERDAGRRSESHCGGDSDGGEPGSHLGAGVAFEGPEAKAVTGRGWLEQRLKVSVRPLAKGAS
jgi:hypothetical protein